MEKGKTKAVGIPKFANEEAEADWWASAEGRKFLKAQPAHPRQDGPLGSKLVGKLAKVNSVQIALRLSSLDVAKAREIAERKGIGYQTLLKMIVHEGLQRVERQR